MTRFELALKLLADKDKLDDTVYVRREDGSLSDDILMQYYDDIDGLTLNAL